ncbi:MAG: delta-60 repeat domain-containing protein [Flavobacteriales bacterium]|nr:delta-60 repeat domain-containing protein [Flavobacteriales bacterium]
MRPSIGIVRLNTDGSGDGSFDVGSGFDNTITALALQPDGKVMRGLSNSYFNGQPTDGIVRLLNTDGSRDATFSMVLLLPPCRSQYNPMAASSWVGEVGSAD